MRRVSLFCLLALCLAACANEKGRQFVVFFPTDSMTLTDPAQHLVTDLAKTLGDARSARLVVEGTADGGTPHDLDLANERGRAVVDALTEAGIDPTRIETVPGAIDPDDKGVAAHKVVIRLEP